MEDKLKSQAATITWTRSKKTETVFSEPGEVQDETVNNLRDLKVAVGDQIEWVGVCDAKCSYSALC
jgi:hypothetical protein